MDDDDIRPDEIGITFGLRSYDLDPDRITEQLGVQPTWAFAKGDEYEGRAWEPQTRTIRTERRKRPSGVWALNSPEPLQKADVVEQAEWFLKTLEPVSESIRTYVADPRYTVSFRISWETWAGHGGYDIPSDVLSRMAALCDVLIVSNLCHEGEAE